MKRNALLDDLERTERQLRFGYHMLQRQKELVADLERKGFDTTSDQRLLHQLEVLQAHHHRERNLLIVLAWGPRP